MARRGSPDTVTIVWLDPHGREVVRVEFPRPIFARIGRAAAALNITLQQFCDNAVAEFIKRGAPSLCRRAIARGPHED